MSKPRRKNSPQLPQTSKCDPLLENADNERKNAGFLEKGEFGAVMGWWTQVGGAKARMKSVDRQYINYLKNKGVTRTLIDAWKELYECAGAEEVKNKKGDQANPTAEVRAKLMALILESWECN